MKRIIVNWMDQKSIRSAEIRKAILENKGYTLVGQEIGFNYAILIYKKEEQCN